MTRKVTNLFREKRVNIIMFIMLDLLALLFASFVAIWLRFDFGTIPEPYATNSYDYFIFDFLILFTIFIIFKLYTTVWKYASVTELIDILAACTLFEFLSYIYKIIFSIEMPRSFFIIQFFLLVAFICSTRLGYRAARTLYIKFKSRSGATNTMLIGAGDAGRMIIDEVYNNSETLNTKIVCVIDDNKNKIGSYIKGIKIEGSTKDIERLAEKYGVTEIIIAIPSASKEAIDKIVTECHKTEANIKILPSL